MRPILCSPSDLISSTAKFWVLLAKKGKGREASTAMGVKTG